MHLTHVRCALHQAHAGPHLFVSGRVPVTPILGECLAKPEVLHRDAAWQSASDVLYQADVSASDAIKKDRSK